MLPEGMLLGHSPAQEIERQPAAFVLIVSLIPELRSAPDVTEILGLDELSGRIDLSDFLHRQLDCSALVNECAHHLPFIALVRVPMSVERREAGGRQWFVDRREGVDPWVPLADRSRKSCQVVRELWIEQSRPAWTAAVMTESDNGPDAKLAHSRQPFVGPAPVGLRWISRHHALPEHGVTKCFDTEFGESVEIVEPLLVTGPNDLVHVAVTDSVDRALDSAPEFQH